MANREYRFVGGERHGQIYWHPGSEAIGFDEPPDLSLPLRDQATVQYVERSFGSAGIPDTRPFALRMDVMLHVKLAQALDADPRDPDVAWQILDAFFIDLPGSRRTPRDEAVDFRSVRVAFGEAMSALKRARKALPKEVAKGTPSRVAWAIFYADNGVTRIKHALEKLDEQPATDTTPEDV